MSRISGALGLAFALSGCATPPEISLMFGPRQVNGNTEASASLEVRQRIGRRFACAYSHSSEPARGRPFNDDDETNVDSAMCGVRFGGP